MIHLILKFDLFLTNLFQFEIISLRKRVEK